MSIIKTQNCVICGSPDIVVASGHVIRKDTYIAFGNPHKDISIIASRCAKHEDEFRKDGYFGEYKEWMGMCDDSFKKKVKKLDFTEITERLLNVIAEDDKEFNAQLARVIGISEAEFNEYLDYVKIEKVGDARDNFNP